MTLQQNLPRLRHYASLLADDISQRFTPASQRYSHRILLNSFPKSGTHMLEALLRQVPGLVSPMHRTMRRETQHKEARLRKIRRGTFQTGHLAFDATLREVIRQQELRHLLIFRDPKKVIVSEIRYLTGQHTAHPFAKEFLALKTREDQVRLVLTGGENFKGLGPRLAAYLPWTECPEVCTLKFEDIYAAMETGDPARFSYVLEFLDLDFDESEFASLCAQARAKRGLTYSGKTSGDWAEAYDQQSKELYLEHVQPIAEKLGYPGLPWD